MRYVGDTRGKRLRPILVLLSAKLLGEVNEQTLRAAAFVELVHSATLLHDDVVDDDDERRGRSSVKAQFGNLSAVLAGDFLLAKAMLLLSAPGDHAILQEMLRTAAAMSEGELMQGTRSLSPSKGRGEEVETYKGRPFDKLRDLNPTAKKWLSAGCISSVATCLQVLKKSPRASLIFTSIWPKTTASSPNLSSPIIGSTWANPNNCKPQRPI